MIINYSQLKKAHCCRKDFKRFLELFGETDVEMTQENVLKAKELNLEWFAGAFFPGELIAHYSEAVRTPILAFREDGDFDKFLTAKAVLFAQFAALV
jgi:hypothetical protein